MKFFTFSVLLFSLVILVSCHSSEKNTARETDQPLNVEQLILRVSEKINSNPNDDRLYIERANYFLTIDSIQSALRDITIAIDINDQDPNHYITLSEAYLALGNPDRCIEGLEKALEIEPKNQEALLKKAQLFLIMKQYDKTYETIDELIKIDSYNPTAYLTRGYALLEQGDTIKAIRNLQTTIDQKQDYFEAYIQLGVVYINLGNPLAADYLSNAIELRPNSPEAYYLLGMFFQENDEPDKAIEIYNNILAIEPQFTFALYNLGYIYLVYFKEYETAAGYFTQAVELDPNNYEAYYNRGYCYELLGNKSEARIEYQKSLELKPNYELAIKGLNRLD